MAFELSLGGFFGFMTRPFTSVYGWIMLAGIAFYIFMRVTGRIGGFVGKKDQSKDNVDYKIK